MLSSLLANCDANLLYDKLAMYRGNFRLHRFTLWSILQLARKCGSHCSWLWHNKTQVTFTGSPDNACSKMTPHISFQRTVFFSFTFEHMEWFQSGARKVCQIAWVIVVRDERFLWKSAFTMFDYLFSTKFKAFASLKPQERCRLRNLISRQMQRPSDW